MTKNELKIVAKVFENVITKVLAERDEYISEVLLQLIEAVSAQGKLIEANIKNNIKNKISEPKRKLSESRNELNIDDSDINDILEISKRAERNKNEIMQKINIGFEDKYRDNIQDARNKSNSVDDNFRAFADSFSKSKGAILDNMIEDGGSEYEQTMSSNVYTDIPPPISISDMKRAKAAVDNTVYDSAQNAPLEVINPIKPRTTVQVPVEKLANLAKNNIAEQ
jgi:hypothetical protein